MKQFLVFFSVILLATWCFGHSRILPGGNIPPRSTNPGLKVGPCGNVAKGTPVATFNAGQVITLQWEETINHPGYYEFSISSDGDQTFTMLTTVKDNQNNVNDLPHRYQVNLTLPAGLECTNCTLRMVQQMTENPANPQPYFSCADIEIANIGTDTPIDPVDDPPPTDTPPPTEDCHSN